MEGSKFESLLTQEKGGYLKEEIIQSACDCELCFHDVKPLVQPEKQRQRYKQQFYLHPTEALHFFYQKAHGYRGTFIIPDAFFISESQLFFVNDSGRLKCRQKQTNLDAKKHFDEKRRKYQKNYKTKQIAILIFKNGSSQLLSEAHLNKVLLKRKNDPLWLETKVIILLPPTKQPLEYQELYYKRNETTMNEMAPIFDKIVEDVDSYQDKTNKDDSLRNASLILSMSKSKFGFLVDSEKMFKQAIAYIQVVHKIRILSGTFRFIEDIEGQPYFLELNNFIATYLQESEQRLALHDRFKQLEIIGEEQLAQDKSKMDFYDQEVLWDLCTGITLNCIQKRKVELKIKNCKKLSNKELRAIFMKIFPSFSPEDIFQNPNWNNEIGDFVKSSKQQIQKLIRADEGISILKRFGIIFHRTF